MSLVTQFYDSNGVPAAIHSVGSLVDDVSDANVNEVYPSRAAAERGTLDGLAGGSVSVCWWRQGGDVNLVAMAASDGTAGCGVRVGTVQRAVVRMPQDAVTISCIHLTNHSATTSEPSSLVGVVATMKGSEVLCARVHVGSDDKTHTLFVRTLPDTFTSLRVANSRSAVTAAAAAAIPSSQPAGSSAAAQFCVLTGDAGGALVLAVFADDGSSSIRPIIAGSSAAAAAAVTAIAAVKGRSGLFIVAYADGSVVVADVHSVGPTRTIGHVKAHHGGATAIAASATLTNGQIFLAIATAAGNLILASLAEGPAAMLSTTVVSQPTEGAVVGSLYLSEDGSATVGWLGCELWSIPTTCVNAHRCHDASSAYIVSTYGDGDASQMLWLMEGQHEPFWFTHRSVLLMAVAGPVDGNLKLFVASNASIVSELVAGCTFSDYDPAEGVNAHAHAKDTFAVTAVPLVADDGIAAARLLAAHERETRAFVRGLSVLRCVPNSVYSIQYLFHRALSCPNRFANFSEFSELRTDALVNPMEGLAVTADHVRSALDFIAVAEDTVNAFYATPMYLRHAVSQDLSARLLYLIVVFAAWVSTSISASAFADSEVTAEVGHRAEVLVAAIRAVHALGDETWLLLSAQEGSTSEDDTPANGSQAAVSAVVNTLSQIDAGDVADMVRVGRLLTAVVPHGSAGSRAASHWASILKARNPLMAHFHMASSIAANNTKGCNGAVLIAESFSVAAHLALLPLEVAKQLLATLGLYAYYPASISSSSAAPSEAAALLANDVEALIDAYPALLPKLYKVLVLRRMVTTHSSAVATTHIESGFLPELHIVRRYAADMRDEGSMAVLGDFLTSLVIDVSTCLCRAAIDEQNYAEAFRLLSMVSREASAAHTAGIATAVAARRDTIWQYVCTAVDRILAEGREHELSSAALVDTDLNEMIAQRLYWLAQHQTHGPAALAGTSTGSSRTPPHVAEANESRRFATACTLSDFLCRRHAYGIAAHALFSIAAAARTSSQATVGTAAHVVKLMTLAVSAAKSIPLVPPPPSVAPTSGMNRLQSFTAMSPTLGQLHDLPPMSRLDVPLLEKRLCQARCEAKLQRIPRNVAKGSWREDAADRTRIERLVEELLTVRLWDDARRMSALAGLDVNLVYQCEAADLASSDYSTSNELRHKWDSYVSRLTAASTATNGYLPLQKALGGALVINHRHVPPCLKEALAERDLGALLTILLNSGKAHVAASFVSSTATSPERSQNGGRSLHRDSSTISIGSIGQKKLAGSLIWEVLNIACRYIKARDGAAKVTVGSRDYADHMRRCGFASNALISYPLLERIAAVAHTVVAAGPSGDHADRRLAVFDIATEYIALLANRNK